MAAVISCSDFMKAVDEFSEFHDKNQVTNGIDELVSFITEHSELSYACGIIDVVPLLIDMRRLAVAVSQKKESLTTT